MTTTDRVHDTQVCNMSMYVYMFMQNLTVCIVPPSLTEKMLDNFFCSVSTKRRKWTIEEETMLKNVCESTPIL